MSISAWTIGGGGCAGAPAVGYSEYSLRGTLRTHKGVGCTHRSCSRESLVRPHAAETNKRVYEDNVNRQRTDADGNSLVGVHCSVGRPRGHRAMPYVGVLSLDGSGRAHRWSRLAPADNALPAVGGSDLYEAAMRTHPHVRTGLHAFLRASAPPTWTVPQRRATRCRAACRCGGTHPARRPCTH
jgi:hypothetical protein